MYREKEDRTEEKNPRAKEHYGITPHSRHSNAPNECYGHVFSLSYVLYENGPPFYTDYEKRHRERNTSGGICLHMMRSNDT
ncbi:hypothetical protein QE152_g11085 [Popillia japonica]|uniref:Uncharacterized protein n=1 Tax=Popillia japonica TaxID=7064 RepID=A0AAW1LR79_POPJA